MKLLPLMAVAVVATAGTLAVHAVQARQPGVRRTDLQHHDLSAAGREVVQAQIEIDPGVTAARHWHPGEEIIYVLEGVLEYQVAGRSPVTLRRGDVLFVPARTIHSAKNVGDGRGVELATYVVEKGQPLVVMAD